MKVRTTLGILSLVAVLSAVLPANAQYTADVADGFELYITGENVVFRNPAWSGTTVKYDQTDPLVEPNGIWGTNPDLPDAPWSITQVVESGGFESDKSLETYFLWGNPADTDDPPGFVGDPDTGGDDVIRCTTHSTTYLPRPSCHFGGSITMKIAILGYTDEFYTPAPGASIYVAFAVTETGKLVALGEEDSAGGDLEYVYIPGSELIPDAGTNGALPPLPDGDGMPPYGKKFVVTTNYPPQNNDFHTVTIDFPTADIRGWTGDGILDATAIGDNVNRGNLESILYSNDPDDTVGKFFFVYIDDIVFNSPEPDPAYPPTIDGPIDPCDTIITVQCDDDASLATLYINDVEADTAVPSSGTATFNGSLSLNQGDVLTATQTMFGQVSELSEPIVVQNVAAPLVVGPIYASDTSVLVSCDNGAQTAELFINGVSAGTTTPSLGQATFNSLSLSTWDSITATQTKCAGQTSPVSGPVQVYLNSTWVVADDFDHYTAQDGFRQIWPNDVEPSDVEAQTFLAQGGAASCELFMEAYVPAQTDGARTHKYFADGINGTDATPLWISYQMKLGSTSGSTRFRFDLATGTGLPSASVSPAGSLGFGFTNGLAGDFGTQYTVFIEGHDPVLSGFESDYFGVDYGLTGIAREANVWKTFQIEVRTSVVNYYIDGVLANPAGYEAGVPRPNQDDFYHLLIGLNYSTNTSPIALDDLQIVKGDIMLPIGNVFAPAAIQAAPNSPVIHEPIVPGETIITLDVDTNASLVEVMVDGVLAGSLANPATPTVDITISAVGDGEVLTATQTINGDMSCLSNAATTSVPTVAVTGPIDVGSTTVNITNIHPMATNVTVYVDDIAAGSATPSSDTVDVTVPALVVLNEVSATQTILVEGPQSPRVVVGTTVVVNEFCYDDSGIDDHGFIELYNYGGELDISEWVIQVGDYVEGQIPEGVYYQHIIPSGTIIPANGYYTLAQSAVQSVPGAVIDSIDDNLRLDNGMNYVCLRTPRRALIDAVGYELNKEYAYGYEFLPEEIYSQIGRGIWGNAVMNDSPLMADARWIDGLDTDENGRDWGIQRATPGFSNNMPDFGADEEAYVDDFNGGTVGADVPDWVANYVQVRYFDPTVADAALNPVAIPASPDGGLAATMWDESGGGDAHFLGLLAKEDVRFEAYAYLDPTPTDNGYEEFKVGIRGTSDGLHNFDAYNGATGVCMLFQRFNSTISPTHVFYLLDEQIGGLSVGAPRYAVILGEYDMVAEGVTLGWNRIMIETEGTDVTAIIGGTYGTDEGDIVLNAAHESYGPGGYWVSYREAVDGTVSARPAQFDKITVSELDPPIEKANVVDVFSMANHGTAGDLGIQIYPVQLVFGQPFNSESRYGLTQNVLEIGLDAAITDASGVTVTATDTAMNVFTATVALDLAGDKLIATFSPVLADQKIYTIDVAGDAVNAFQCEYVTLIGNVVNLVGMNTVNTTDRTILNTKLGQTANVAGAQYDIFRIGTSNGAVDTTDRVILNTKLGGVAN